MAKPVETGENYEVYGSEFPEEARVFASGYLVKTVLYSKDKKWQQGVS